MKAFLGRGTWPGSARRDDLVFLAGGLWSASGKKGVEGVEDVADE